MEDPKLIVKAIRTIETVTIRVKDIQYDYDNGEVYNLFEFEIETNEGTEKIEHYKYASELINVYLRRKYDY